MSSCYLAEVSLQFFQIPDAGGKTEMINPNLVSMPGNLWLEQQDPACFLKKRRCRLIQMTDLPSDRHLVSSTQKPNNA